MDYTLPPLLNRYNVVECLAAVKSTLAKDTSATLILNAANVTKIDSAGIALLVELDTIKNIRLINLNNAINQLANLYQIQFK